MKFGLLLFVAIAGILNTVQSGSNATLNKAIDRPVWAAVYVLGIGLLSGLVVAIASGQRLPLAEDIASVPWWGWIGGVFGSVYILALMLAADKLGAAVFMGLTVTMATLTSLAMDHYGWMGFDRHPVGVGRIAGGLLMVAGVALIARF